MGHGFDEEREVINALYYGPQGTWKTTHMARMANLGPVCYVDMESGLKKRALVKRGVNVDNISIERPRNYKEFEALYWRLAEALDGKPDALAGCVFDSYTEMQALLVDESVRDRVVKYERALEKGNIEADNENLNENFTGQNDYGQWTNQARKLTRKFRDLPCHIAFGALEKKETISGEVHLVPKLTQAFREDIMGYVDMIVNTTAVESEYALSEDGIEGLGIMRHIKQGGWRHGKDRWSITPVVLANPTFDKLVGLLEGTHDLSTDPDQLAFLKRINGGQTATQSAKPGTEVESNNEDA